jgi:UTP-glucose-1-phosphate uridylyltransferase
VDSGIEEILIITGRNKTSIENHFDKSVELELNNLLEDKMEYEKMSKASNPYGDGFASKRITDILIEKLWILNILVDL